MSSALSPITISVEKDEGPGTRKSIVNNGKYLSNAVRNLIFWTKKVYELPPNEKARIDDNNYMDRKKLNQFEKALTTQILEFSKLCSKKKTKKSKNKNKNSGNKLCYVSDQLIELFQHSDLGRTLYDDEDSSDLKDELELLFTHRMATTPLLTSIFSRFIDVNNLKSKEHTSRFDSNNLIKKYLKDTVYMLDGTDLSDREVPHGTSKDKIEKIDKDVADSNKSVIQKLKKRKNKKGESMYDDKKGFTYTSTMVIVNYFRIPNELLTDDEREKLEREEYIEEASKIKDVLSKFSEEKKREKKQT